MAHPGRCVYKPPPTDEAEAEERDDFDDEEFEFIPASFADHIPDELLQPELPALELEEKLIDLGINPDDLRQFCRVATIVPKPLPVDPWESYDAVHTSAQEFVKELKRCGAKTYHIRQALEGAMTNLDGDEDDERRVNYEGASAEAKKAQASQQSGIAGSDDEAQGEEAKEKEA